MLDMGSKIVIRLGDLHEEIEMWNEVSKEMEGDGTEEMENFFSARSMYKRIKVSKNGK